MMFFMLIKINLNNSLIFKNLESSSKSGEISLMLSFLNNEFLDENKNEHFEVYI